MLYLWLSKDRKTNTQKAFSLLCQQGWGKQTLLVPEQFSHQTQKAFCGYAGDSASLMAEVLDFAHLAQRVFCQEGGIAQIQTDAVGQLLMMALAVEQVRSRLKIYGVGAAKPEFLIQLLDMFEEFRSFCVTPSALRKAAGELQGILAQKTEEFALLMESYDAVCENCGQNPQSRLSRLSEMLEECDFGEGERFCFDGFTDFNGIQLEIIGKLLTRAGEVHIFLQCDDLQRGGQQFNTARDTVKALLCLCSREEIDSQVCFLPSGEETEPLTFLREHLFSGDGKVYPTQQEKIVFIKGKDTLQQCRAAAGEILRLISEGARWRDVTIACPDFQTYQPVLSSVLHRAGIPSYFAGDRDILRQSVVHMLLSALEAATGFMEQEAVLAYLKSGFSPVSREDCDRLENYILLWNITASRFDQPWTMHPMGIGKDFDLRSQEELQNINAAREHSVEPLLRLRKGLKSAGKTGDMVLVLHRFMEEIGLEEILLARGEACRQEGQLQRAQEYVQLYDILIGILEQMYGILGSSQRNGEDFYAMFKAALSRSSVGTIPAHLDCVSVGSLMSQRRSDTPYLFLLGANEGSFPSGQNKESLLTDPERSSLMSIGLGVSPTAAGRLERELAAMDSVLSAPEKRLYLGAVSGCEAYYIRRAEELFPNAPQCVGEKELICRSEREYLEYLTGNPTEDADLPQIFEQAKKLSEAKDYAPEALTRESVEALYGKTLRLSSSKIDALATCRFAYFLNYGLKAQERKSAQVDPSLYGTFVHDVLEHTAKQIQKEGGFHQTTLQRVLTVARERMEQYAKLELADLWQSARAEYLFRRNFAEIELVVTELFEELSKSEFEPMWFELHFAGQEGDLPAVRIVGEKMTAQLEGFVDRADVWDSGEKLYVRVVDYKTGKKKFEYTNILHGLGLQMLLYLFTLVRKGDVLLNKPMTPAGVLYFPARYDQVSMDGKQNRGKMEEKRRKNQVRNGLILNEERTLQAMEPCQENPVYLPYSYDKEGNRKGYLADAGQMGILADFVFEKVAELGDELYSGSLEADPYFLDTKYNGCAWCPYGTVCRDSKKERWLKKVKDSEEFWQRVGEAKKHG